MAYIFVEVEVELTRRVNCVQKAFLRSVFIRYHTPYCDLDSSLLSWGTSLKQIFQLAWNGKIFNQRILPNENNRRKTESNARSMLDLSLKDRVRMQEIRRCRWYYTTQNKSRNELDTRMVYGRWTKTFLEWTPTAIKRSRNRPPIRWIDDLKITTNWIATAAHRVDWRRLQEVYVQQLMWKKAVLIHSVDNFWMQIF